MPLDVELTSKNLSGNHRAVAPPDPIPNSEVKRSIADGSVGFPHVRVGHFQAPNKRKSLVLCTRDFFLCEEGGVGV